MRKIGLLIAALGTIIVPMLTAAPASAQATRTWVSGVGDDVNPCSRTAPCKTFAGAISKTAAAGEINCIDPGGFGTVTITKSITLNCTGTFGSILASGTNGINVSTAGIVVVLKGLSINGASTGLVGINVLQPATVLVEDSIIQGFQSGNATGILVKPAANASLTRVTLNRVSLLNNSAGMFVDSTNNPGIITVTARDSNASGNAFSGFEGNAGTTEIRMMIDRTTSVNNGNGAKSNNAQSKILIANSTFTGNNAGLSVVTGGQIFSAKTNNIVGNTTDGAPTAFFTPN